MPDRVSQGAVIPLRADARRNHDALLTAAAAVFAAAGVDAPIKEIADQAGVGVATFYRRFPTRADLIVAVLRQEVDGCAGAADVLVAQYPPFEALTRWIDRFLDLVVKKRGLAAALQSDAPGYAALRADFEAKLVPSLQGLMNAAADDVRAGISAAELWQAIALLCGAATPCDFQPTRRMVALLINGLQTPEQV